MDNNERIAGLLNSYREQIRAKSPVSLAAWQQNRTVMPAGVGSLFRLADPFPMVVKRAKGARIWDADDNEYLDSMLGFSVMILGNAPAEVEDAIRQALPRGTSYGTCHEYEWSMIVSRVLSSWQERSMGIHWSPRRGRQSWGA